MTIHDEYPEDPENATLDAVAFDVRHYMRMPALLDPKFGPILLSALNQGQNVMLYQYSVPVNAVPTSDQMDTLTEEIGGHIDEHLPELLEAAVHDAIEARVKAHVRPQVRSALNSLFPRIYLAIAIVDILWHVGAYFVSRMLAQ